MPALSIHKYDKSNPNYLEDWTSISDIGGTFYGKVMTLDDYLAIENQYVKTIEQILTLFNINYFEVGQLEKSFSLRFQRRVNLLNDKQCRLFQQMDNGFLLTGESISELVRFNLREALWCRLYNSDIQIHFGYDYYMYVQSQDEEKLEQCKKIIRENNLYYQEFPISPYQIEEEDIDPFTYSWGDGHSNPPGDYHHDLRISKDNPLNRTYTEWSNFDEIEHELDWKEYQTTEQKYLQLLLDFLEVFQVSELTNTGLHLQLYTFPELGVSEQYFSPKEKALFRQMYEFEETVEDSLESFIVLKKDLSTLFKLMFKGVLTNWFTDGSITIQFDSSYRLYLSFYGHKEEVKELVEKHGLYWQERQPPYHEVVSFT